MPTYDFYVQTNNGTKLLQDYLMYTKLNKLTGKDSVETHAIRMCALAGTTK
jgi:hypothetical protein